MKMTQKIMENDLNKKWKTNQSTKINLIGCDTIVNSPSLILVIVQFKNITYNIPKRKL